MSSLYESKASLEKAIHSFPPNWDCVWAPHALGYVGSRGLSLVDTLKAVPWEGICSPEKTSPESNRCYSPTGNSFHGALY